MISVLSGTMPHDLMRVGEWRHGVKILNCCVNFHSYRLLHSPVTGRRVFCSISDTHDVPQKRKVNSVFRVLLTYALSVGKGRAARDLTVIGIIRITSTRHVLSILFIQLWLTFDIFETVWTNTMITFTCSIFEDFTLFLSVKKMPFLTSETYYYDEVLLCFYFFENENFY